MKFPVPTAKIRTTREFVSGTLKGLTYDDTVTVPKSRLAKELASFQVMIETGRVIRGIGSAYRFIYAEQE